MAGRAIAGFRWSGRRGGLARDHRPSGQCASGTTGLGCSRPPPPAAARPWSVSRSPGGAANAQSVTPACGPRVGRGGRAEAEGRCLPTSHRSVCPAGLCRARAPLPVPLSLPRQLRAAQQDAAGARVALPREPRALPRCVPGWGGEGGRKGRPGEGLGGAGPEGERGGRRAAAGGRRGPGAHGRRPSHGPSAAPLAGSGAGPVGERGRSGRAAGVGVWCPVSGAASK